MPIITGGVTSSASAGALTLITNTVLAAPAASIDLTAIPGTFTHLLMFYSMRSTIAEINAQTGLRLNNDSGANYQHEHVWGTGSSAAAGSNSAATTMAILGEMGASAVANVFATGQVIFPYYALAGQQRTAQSIFNLMPAANPFAGTMAGLWSSTAAITRITLLASDNVSNLATGSGAALYGLT